MEWHKGTFETQEPIVPLHSHASRRLYNKQISATCLQFKINFYKTKSGLNNIQNKSVRQTAAQAHPCLLKSKFLYFQYLCLLGLLIQWNLNFFPLQESSCSMTSPGALLISISPQVYLWFYKINMIEFFPFFYPTSLTGQRICPSNG